MLALGHKMIFLTRRLKVKWWQRTKKQQNKSINNPHTIHYVEKRTNIVNFQIVWSVDVALVSVGRRNLGGLSNDDKMRGGGGGGGEKWKNKALYGQYPRILEKPHVDTVTTNKWLSSNLKGETEGLLVAAQDQAINSGPYRIWMWGICQNRVHLQVQ